MKGRNDKSCKFEDRRRGSLVDNIRQKICRKKPLVANEPRGKDSNVNLAPCALRDCSQKTLVSCSSCEEAEDAIVRHKNIEFLVRPKSSSTFSQNQHTSTKSASSELAEIESPHFFETSNEEDILGNDAEIPDDIESLLLMDTEQDNRLIL